MIPDVTNQDGTVAIEGDAMRLIELGLICRSSVSCESTHSAARRGRNHTVFHVDLPDDVIVAFGNIKVALGIEQQLMGHIERCLDRRATIAFVTLLSVPCDGGHS